MRTQAVGSANLQMTGDPHVVLNDITKTYELKGDAIEFIRSVSFQVDRGGFVSILGPSGCGKSTLLMMLAGIVPATSGRIAINGETIDRPSREISLVFQTPHPLSLAHGTRQRVVSNRDIQRRPSSRRC